MFSQKRERGRRADGRFFLSGPKETSRKVYTRRSGSKSPNHILRRDMGWSNIFTGWSNTDLRHRVWDSTAGPVGVSLSLQHRDESLTRSRRGSVGVVSLFIPTIKTNRYQWFFNSGLDPHPPSDTGIFSYKNFTLYFFLLRHTLEFKRVGVLKSSGRR